MAGEEIAKYALNSTIGKGDFKPLDKIIEQNTSIKIQTVTFNFTGTGETKTRTIEIEEIDTSKTIIHKVSDLLYHPDLDVASISFALNANSITATLQQTSTSNISLNYTVQLITFGATVEGG